MALGKSDDIYYKNLAARIRANLVGHENAETKLFPEEMANAVDEVAKFNYQKGLFEGGEGVAELAAAVEELLAEIESGRFVETMPNSSDLNQLYGELSENRGPTMFAVCNGPTAASDHIPQRTKDGLMLCVTPDDGADNICANKGYVDKFSTAILSGLDSIITAQNELLGGDV